ncbi:MAG: peptide ABC transporter substrate-binding protein, partial [Anaerolineae bacterium]
MADKNRWIPLLAVILVVCLGATCLVGVVGGSVLLQRAAPEGESSRVEPDSAAPTLAAPRQEGGAESGGESGQPEAPEAPSFPPAAPGEQVLTLPGGDPPTLDPHLSGDATSAVYVVEIYSGLLAYDLELNLVPDIAEDWDVSDDGTVYTFYLRDGVQFHNGKPVRAQDFKWSFERACDFRTGSSTADTYLGDIVGCRDKLRGRADEVSGVQVIDDQTLELTIDAPKAYFLAKLTYPTAYVLDRENVERGGRTWTDQPNGTGPFVLDEFVFGESIVLKKNPNYYRDPQPQLDRVNFTLTGGSAMIRYENDELDATPVGLNDIERVTDPTNPLNADLMVSTRLSVFYLGFSVNQPPFDDPLVRQAFNYALNKEKIVSVVYKETVPTAQGIVPPGVPGYNNPDLVPIPYDPDKALELIAESKYGDVSEFPEITLFTSGVGGSPARITEAIVASYLETLGVEIAIQQTDWPTFLADITRDENPYQMYELGWIADYPDPQNFVDILFHSKSRQNHMGYSNPELD